MKKLLLLFGFLVVFATNVNAQYKTSSNYSYSSHSKSTYVNGYTKMELMCRDITELLVIRLTTIIIPLKVITTLSQVGQEVLQKIILLKPTIMEVVRQYMLDQKVGNIT